MLDAVGLKLSDISVLEYNDALSARILAIKNDKFHQDVMTRKEKVGEVDMDEFNLWARSLIIKHLVGATGVRLAMHFSPRLIKEDGQYALIAECRAGGGHDP